VELMIFKAGKYPQGEWPKERVARLAEAYGADSEARAPVVIGHRMFGQDDEYQMAHGWVEGLRVDGAGKLFARIEDWSPKARFAIAHKQLRYMSVELFEDDKTDPARPPCLRAVALLGRDTPAVAGARLPTVFSRDGFAGFTLDVEKGITAFTRKLTPEDIAEVSARGAEEEAESMEEIERLKAQFAESSARVASLQKENDELRNAGRKAEAEAFFGKLRDAGKLPPALFEKALALDATLDSEASAQLRSLFGELQTKVDLSAGHVAEKPAAGAGGESGLTAKIRAYQKEKGIGSFAEAAVAFHAANPAVFEEEEGAA